MITAAFCYLALLVCVAVWLAVAFHAAPFEQVEWTMPELPSIVDLPGDAQDRDE